MTSYRPWWAEWLYRLTAGGLEGREVHGCRELGCYSATLGPFCVACKDAFAPERIDEKGGLR
jgi:hypothetical protein